MLFREKAIPGEIDITLFLRQEEVIVFFRVIVMIGTSTTLTIVILGSIAECDPVSTCKPLEQSGIVLIIE
jgi:hypothetical protein